jgi:biopolymer transport protein ExbD
MAMRITESFGLIALFASLLMTHSALVKEYESPGGITVLFPHPCTQYENRNPGHRRDVIVRYHVDHSSFVNRHLMPVEDDLRREIVTLMSTRHEQVISFEADERLGYGEVLAVLSDLKKDDPELFIALLSKEQIDSADVQWPRINNLCLS